MKALEDAGKNVWAKMDAAGAKSLIVAELKEDRSDLMTDYFHSVTVKTVILCTSKTSRNNFKDFRELADQASIPEIQALATAPPEHKHRENNSGRGGYYLGELLFRMDRSEGTALWGVSAGAGKGGYSVNKFEEY
ncbi:MAG: hypothetical protein HGB01_06355 [Chlorobiaceae bacterium]|nr:hypothetical protein [Chlorobiaceae bacterium]